MQCHKKSENWKSNVVLEWNFQLILLIYRLAVSNDGFLSTKKDGNVCVSIYFCNPERFPIKNNPMRFLRIVLVLSVFVTLCASLPATPAGYNDFDNFYPAADASVVNCFVQDKQGLIWVGTNKGLYSYNGFVVTPHVYVPEHSPIQAETRINCGLMLDATTLCLGSDNGMLIYDIRTDSYRQLKETFPTDVRALALRNNQLWIGSLNGLYCYDLRNRTLRNVSREKNNGIPHRAIYSLLSTPDGSLFAGTYNGLCVLTPGASHFWQIKLPIGPDKSSLLVNSLLDDRRRNCLWIGTEGYLFRYDLRSGIPTEVSGLNGNSIKSLTEDKARRLLIGTDNGLYVYTPETNGLQHVVHDSRNPKSLTNNIIWTIFSDMNGNAWFGTDYGVSYYRYNRNLTWVPVSEITDSGDGNQLQCIFRDSRKNLWLGGTNGLICSPADGSVCRWYRMGDPQYPVSHNRIRAIYEDREGELWVATDGSINRFDFSRKQFVHYNIIDRSRTRNANWAYQLFEDANGKLWIASCLGGIFVVDKQKLLASKDNYYVAERNYYKTNRADGLSDNYILRIVPDRQGNVWALTYNNTLNRIDARSGNVTRVAFMPDGVRPANGSSYAMMCDREGALWIGYAGGLTRIPEGSVVPEFIRPELFRDQTVHSLTTDGSEIRILGSEGLYGYDPARNSLRYIPLLNKSFSCLFSDSLTHRIYLGGADGFALLPSETLRHDRTSKQLVMTSILVNDKALQPDRDYNGQSVRYLHDITLRYSQNNLTFIFSDLSYSEDESNNYLYRLEGADAEWRILRNNSNRLSFSNLPPGDYRLAIALPATDGANPQLLMNFGIRILPPWYYSFWAKIVYALCVLALTGWVAYYFMEKHRTRIERIGREKTLELSRMKIDFFTNVSHDFKTPMSLIIGPLSSLLMEVKSPGLKKQLSLIQKNALHLNALIQQVVGLERMDGMTANSLMLSQVEIVEFCRSIFSVYEQGFAAKQIRTQFATNVEALVMQLDVQKTESILNNLISNALKYTGAGGEVILQLAAMAEQGVQISLSDTGIGIAPADLAFVFDRFYQSERTRTTQEGTGIGLYLVKSYVELQGGQIRLESDVDKGTTVHIQLPLSDNGEATVYDAEQMPEEPGSENELILVVEDNPEVCDFIVHVLQSHYRCITAPNGKSGLDKAIAEKPSLIVSDVMMPVMDGLAMCRHIRKRPELTFTPLIVLTAKDDKNTEERSLELGVNAFIAKPFDPSLLLLRIRQLLGERRRMEDKVRLEVIADPKAIEARSWDEKFLSDFTRMIEERIEDAELNVAKLSELSGISTKQVYRRIKQLTGMSPVDYIRSVRMKKAAMLFGQQKFSVAEVMYLVGFSNYSYFSKCFRAAYGKSPKQFMDEIV